VIDAGLFKIVVVRTGNSLLRTTPRDVRARARQVRPIFRGRTGDERATFLFEAQGVTSKDKVWKQQVKIHERAGQRRELVSSLDVTMRCDCPAWLYSGAQWWAHREKYLYGLPRAKVRAPVKQKKKIPLCKHLVAVVEHMQSNRIKIA